MIDPGFILTVAHCVKDYANNPAILKVRLGEWDTQNDQEFLQHEDYDVVEVIVHQEFQSSNLWHDIALLKLASTVTFRPNIDTVCLPDYDESHIGQECVTTGWGKTAYS